MDRNHEDSLSGIQLGNMFISVWLQPIELPTAFRKEVHTLLKVSSPFMTAIANPGVCH